MRLSHLKALDVLVKSDKTYDFVQDVLVNADYLYAVTSHIIVKVHCKEMKELVYKWKCIDMEKAQKLNDEKRFVILEYCKKDCDDRIANWSYDHLDRFFDMSIEHANTYDPKLLARIVRVFSAFGINMRFAYNAKNGLVTFEGFNGNYEISAMLMPLG